MGENAIQTQHATRSAIGGPGPEARPFARAIGATASAGKRGLIESIQPTCAPERDWLLDADLRIALLVIGSDWMMRFDSQRWKRVLADVIWHMALDWTRAPTWNNERLADPEILKWFARRALSGIRRFRDKEVAFDDEDGPGYLFHDLAVMLVKTSEPHAPLDDEFLLTVRATAEHVSTLGYVLCATGVFRDAHDANGAAPFALV